MLLLVGDDWAEDHHDVELQDETGRRLGKGRLPEGIAGIARLHAMIGQHVGDDEDEQVQVVVGIETERGPWVQALLAAGYQVYAINPLQVARYRERHGVSGAKSDPGDVHTLADMVRTDRHQLRPVAGDSDLAEAVKVVTRAHKTLIWERTRHMLRLRRALLDFFPAALAAFDDLDAADTLELLAVAPDPVTAAGLDGEQITAALRRARRRGIPDKVAKIQEALRAPQLAQPSVVAGAYAITVQAQVAILTTFNTQIKLMEQQVGAHFGRHPDAEVYLSQPGLGGILTCRCSRHRPPRRAVIDGSNGSSRSQSRSVRSPATTHQRSTTVSRNDPSDALEPVDERCGVHDSRHRHRSRVGDLGQYRTSTQLAREDTSRRPWLSWIGYLVGFLGVIPGLIAVLIIRELFRFRRN